MSDFRDNVIALGHRIYTSRCVVLVSPDLEIDMITLDSEDMVVYVSSLNKCVVCEGDTVAEVLAQVEASNEVEIVSDLGAVESVARV